MAAMGRHAIQIALLVAAIAFVQGLRPLDSLPPSEAHEPQKSTLGAAPELTPDTPFQWTTRNVVSIVLAAVCALLANGAGVGGGPFYMPLLNSIVGFDLSASTGLSHTIVAVSALASSAYGLTHSSPRDENRTLCDFDIALLFVPSLLLGVDFGVLFNTLFPEYLRTALLTLLLLFVIYKTANKGVKQWKQEQHAFAKKKLGDEHQALLSTSNNGAQPDQATGLNGEAAPEEAKRQDGVLHEESYHTHPLKTASFRESHNLPVRVPSSVAVPQHEGSPSQGFRAVWRRLPLLQIVALVVLWAAFSATQLLKADYPNCSRGYFIVFGLQAGVLFVLIVGLVHYNAQKTKRRPEDSSPELRAIIIGDGPEAAPERREKAERNLFLITAVMFFSGFVAGLLGIGGALIFNPILLQLGVHPQVTASTAVLMILFSSGAISLSFGVQGLLNTSYALVFAPICFVASLTGVTLLGRVIRASGRTSLIVLLLTALIAAGTVLTAVLGGQRAVQEIKAGDTGFRPLCPS